MSTSCPSFISAPNTQRQTLTTLFSADAADGILTSTSGDLGNGQATIAIRLPKRNDAGWHRDSLTRQVACRCLYAIDGRVVSHGHSKSEDNKSKNGECGWLFRLAAAMTPLAGDEIFFFGH